MITINARVEAALAAWVAADKAFYAALRRVPAGPARTTEHRQLAAATRRAGDDEHDARTKLIALLNPDDHRDD
jgi:hypothetical protein